MGCHVSVAPNQQTHRNTSLKTRGETALFGVFGYELDLNILTEEEKEEVRQQIRFVKEHRKLIMTGNFYRLISPFEGDEAAWVVVSEDRTEALAGYYRQRQPANGCYQRLRLSGLDPEAEYQVSGFEGSFYGDELMQAGLVTSDEACGVSDTPSHPGAEVGPKGWAVRPLKRHASWVQNVVRQFGPYPSWA